MVVWGENLNYATVKKLLVTCYSLLLLHLTGKGELDIPGITKGIVPKVIGYQEEEFNNGSPQDYIRNGET